MMKKDDVCRTRQVRTVRLVLATTTTTRTRIVCDAGGASGDGEDAAQKTLLMPRMDGNTMEVKKAMRELYLRGSVVFILREMGNGTERRAKEKGQHKSDELEASVTNLVSTWTTWLNLSAKAKQAHGPCAVRASMSWPITN